MNNIRVPIALVIRDKGERTARLQRLRKHGVRGRLIPVTTRLTNRAVKMRAYSINDLDYALSLMEGKFNSREPIKNITNLKKKVIEYLKENQ